MNFEVFSDFNKLPSTCGIFKTFNIDNECLYIGIGENIKREAKRILSKHTALKEKTLKVEAIVNSDEDLIKTFLGEIRANKPLYNFSLEKQNLYPHIKITNEKFPRLLATRLIEDDGAEYFGAFLPDTKVRFLLGFLIDTFRLRGCNIPVDGDFHVPCPQYFRRKCHAPCVNNLCDSEKYSKAVNFARLFLSDRRQELDEVLLGKINIYSNNLDFETAAKWRDFQREITNVWNQKEWQFRIEEASDSFEIKITDSKFLVNLITRKNRKILGSRIFVFENNGDFVAAEVLEQTLWQFYQFHTPKEITVSIDFPNRQLLEKTLSRRAGKTVKILITKAGNQKKTVNNGFRRSEFEFNLEKLKPVLSNNEIEREFKKIFLLPAEPFRIEAFDVAHISQTDFVGAKSVWEDGEFKIDQYEFWFLDEKNELDAMAKTIEKRFQRAENLPQIILIDGGRAQHSAAISAISKRYKTEISIVSAVKPPRKHNEISYFLLENGTKIKYQENSGALNLLLKLRDEVHQLANYVHRTKRETAHFYEATQTISSLGEKERYFLLQKFGSIKKLKKARESDLINLLGNEKGKLVIEELEREDFNIEPFIVPIRYDDANGNAADLRPIFPK